MENESSLTFSVVKCTFSFCSRRPSQNERMILYCRCKRCLNPRLTEMMCKRRRSSLQCRQKTNSSRFTPFGCAAAGGTGKCFLMNKQKESAFAAQREAMQKGSGCMGIFDGQTWVAMACPPFDSIEDSSGRVGNLTATAWREVTPLLHIHDETQEEPSDG